ncbi:MAG TPA: hypothetical protein VK645_09200 [Chitinophagaceae bacterium]|nr:hypothetical protein [Chitinophagaceae bacterium]
MNKVRAAILFWTIAFLSILPFVILSFFSHPGKEDYYFDSTFKNRSFWNVQQEFYSQWSGRFFVNAVETACIKMNFISNFYFLLTLLLFVFTGIAAFFLARTINKFLLDNRLPVNRLLQVSFIFLLLNIYLPGDIASNFYWFSAAVVYQTPIILLLVLIALLLKRFNQPGQKKLLPDIFITTLIVLLIGCNETFAVAIITILLFAAILSARFQFAEKKIIAIYFLVAFTTGILVLYTSGILNRQKIMQNNTHYFTVLPVIAFRVFMVFYNIFKEPLFWVSSFFCCVAGSFLTNDLQTKKGLLFFKQPKRIHYSLLLLVILITAILTPLMLLSKGSFPERALNNIILIAAIFLLMLAFISGHIIFPGYAKTIMEKIKPLYRVIIPGAAMLLSVSYINAWKSVCSGYFYHIILLERDSQLLQAKNNGQKTVVILSYSTALKQKIKERFPRGGFKIVSELLAQPPTTIPFFNEAEDIAQPGYRLYYGIDRIIIQPDNP